jgi:hypothetical protein
MDTQHVVTAIVVLAGLGSLAGCARNDEWRGVTVSETDHNWTVVLENDRLFVKYSPAGTGVGTKDRITEFRMKGSDESLANALDGRHAPEDTAFFRMSDAREEPAPDDRRTVRLTFDTRVEHVSIFRHMPVLEIAYDQGGHNLDYGITGTNYVFYGEDTWQQLRGWDKKHPTLRDEYDPTGSYYRREWGGPAALSYNGWMIMGVYDERGHGVGITLPADAVSWIKLVSTRGRSGFERMMSGRYRTYLYPVTGGAEEIISTGRQLADSMPK